MELRGVRRKALVGRQDDIDFCLGLLSVCLCVNIAYDLVKPETE